MRPTNIHNIFINQDILRAFKESGVQENIWDVDVDALDTVTFKDCYADGHNQSDRVAGEWCLLNFKYMCPAVVDSDVLVDKSGDDCYKWSRLGFEQEKEHVDTDDVLAVLDASGLVYFNPGDFDDEWPCVRLTATRNEDGEWAQRLVDLEVESHLEVVGWQLGSIYAVSRRPNAPANERVETWSVVPLGHEDDSDDYEDGWYGILLNHVFIVDEERDAAILNEAGFRVLKHEDTGTVIAQVTFCGMSNEANRARAGFLLAVERGWPILTEKGWRRPVR